MSLQFPLSKPAFSDIALLLTRHIQQKYLVDLCLMDLAPSTDKDCTMAFL